MTVVAGVLLAAGAGLALWGLTRALRTNHREYHLHAALLGLTVLTWAFFEWYFAQPR